MKQRKWILGLLPLLCGIIGLGLYMTLLAAGWDDRKLLVAWYWAGVVLCVLSAAVLAGLYLLVRKLSNLRYTRMFPASALGAVGCWLAGAGLAYAAIRELLQGQDKFAIVIGAVGIAAAICLAVTGVYRLKGKIPSYLLYAFVAVYFMLHTVSQYRSWSREPQVMLYLFSFLASVALMFTAYQSAALAAGNGSRKWFVFFNRAALFFCCVSLAGDGPLFYLSMALWTGTGLCSVKED